MKYELGMYDLYEHILLIRNYVEIHRNKQLSSKKTNVIFYIFD